MKIKISEIVEIDLQKEEARLRSLFKGEQLDRQLELLDLFSEFDLERLFSKFKNLPDCPIEGCSEKEFLSNDIYDLIMDNLGKTFEKKLNETRKP